MLSLCTILVHAVTLVNADWLNNDHFWDLNILFTLSVAYLIKLFLFMPVMPLLIRFVLCCNLPMSWPQVRHLGWGTTNMEIRSCHCFTDVIIPVSFSDYPSFLVFELPLSYSICWYRWSRVLMKTNLPDLAALQVNILHFQRPVTCNILGCIITLSHSELTNLS